MTGTSKGVAIGDTDPEGERPLLFRKPFGDGLGCTGKIPTLPESERGSHHGEADDAAYKRVCDMRDGPENHRACESYLCTDSVDYSSKAQIANRIGRLEPKNYRAVAFFRPPQIML